MSEHPWKSEDWFSSAWNFNDEVTKDLHFADKIKIHDVTLRDGEQQTGIAFTYDDKMRIAEGLAEAGIHRIEAGLALSNAQVRARLPGRRGWTGAPQRGQGHDRHHGQSQEPEPPDRSYGIDR